MKKQNDIVASFVIPTHNEGAYLAWTIENVLSSTNLPIEIIVIDDYSLDHSADGLETKYKNVHVIRSEKRIGLVKARNIGVSKCSGEYIVFMDAHVCPVFGWLDKLIIALKDMNDHGIVTPTHVGMSSFKENTIVQHTVSNNLSIEHLLDSYRNEILSAINDIDNNFNLKVGRGMKWKDASLTSEWMDIRPTSASYPVMIASAGCMMASRKFFNDFGGMDTGLKGMSGMTEAELSIRTWLMGSRVEVVPLSNVFVLYRDKYPYGGVKWKDHMYNALYMAIRLLSKSSQIKVFNSYKQYDEFSNQIARLIKNKVMRRKCLIDDRILFPNMFGVRFK